MPLLKPQRFFLIVMTLHLCLVSTLGAEDTKINDLTIRPISHATFVLAKNKNKNTIVIVDPVGGAEAFGDLPTPRLILVTDIHGDHCSPSTVEALAGEKTIIVVPQAVADKFPKSMQSRLKILGNGEMIDGKDGSIEAVPMYNLTEGRSKYHSKGRGNGYILTTGDTRIYISGDTEDIPEMRQLKNIDIAFICMNLPYTMDLKAAASAVLEFKPKVVIPYHYRNKDKTYQDVKAFKKLVSVNPDIEVKLLNWYEKK